jgi:hypothetical protein
MNSPCGHRASVCVIGNFWQCPLCDAPEKPSMERLTVAIKAPKYLGPVADDILAAPSVKDPYLDAGYVYAPYVPVIADGTLPIDAFVYSTENCTSLTISADNITLEGDPDADYFVQARDFVGVTDVPFIPLQITPTAQHLEDIEYFQKKLFAALKIPEKHFKAWSDDVGARSRRYLTGEDD